MAQLAFMGEVRIGPALSCLAPGGEEELSYLQQVLSGAPLVCRASGR